MTGKRTTCKTMKKIFYDKSWAMPGETLWGITQKIKYSNHINSRTLVEVLLPKNRQINNYHFNLSFDDSEEIESLLNTLLFNGNRYSQIEASRLINSYHSRKMKNYQISIDFLNYCPICMQNGYHSFAHQLRLLNYCYLHPEMQLIHCCPRCEKELEYNINTFSQGFVCTCGHSFLKDELPINNFQNWSHFNPKRFEEVVQIEKRSSNNLWNFADIADYDSFFKEHLFRINQEANQGKLVIRETNIKIYKGSCVDLDSYVFSDSKYGEMARNRINRYAKNRKLICAEFPEYIYKQSRIMFKHFCHFVLSQLEMELGKTKKCQKLFDEWLIFNLPNYENNHSWPTYTYYAVREMPRYQIYPQIKAFRGKASDFLSKKFIFNLSDADEFDIMHYDPILISRINFSWIVQHMLIHLFTDTFDSWLTQRCPDRKHHITSLTPFLFRLDESHNRLQIGCLEAPGTRIKRLIAQYT